MRLPLIQNALELGPPDDYFKGRSSEDICIPSNIILFSRTSSQELQRRSFDSYPHHRFVLVFSLMTTGSLTVDGIQWQIEPEQGFLIFPYQFHYYSELAKPNILWLILTFELENPVIMESFRNRLISLDADSMAQLNEIIQDYRQQDTLRTNRRLILKSASLINQLRERLQGGPKAAIASQNTAKRASTELINAIQSFLTINSDSLQSVSDIAEYLHMSESNLRAVFRQHFNISLGAYLKNYRAHQAILYMQNPNLSLTDIAFQLGFTTLSAFSRFFSNSIGESPRNYRNRFTKGST
ncbi:MAG: AraC family transcriptional regulator [Opitutaceae bacterium]|jgi:AraC-like DNA-binding protein|nr:AraC family transcriptional regulator [Opitutaceae bacterium]